MKKFVVHASGVVEFKSVEIDAINSKEAEEKVKYTLNSAIKKLEREHKDIKEINLHDPLAVQL